MIHRSFPVYTSLNDVIDETGIEDSYFIEGLNLPKDIDLNIPLKEISEAYDVEFETESLRELIKSYSIHKEKRSTDCPWNIADDPSPGLCGLYIDKNEDHICDYSE